MAGDDDRDIILKRRRRFRDVAMAGIAGAALSTTASACCLSVSCDDSDPSCSGPGGGVVTPPGIAPASDAGRDSGPPDAGSIVIRRDAGPTDDAGIDDASVDADTSDAAMGDAATDDAATDGSVTDAG